MKVPILILGLLLSHAPFALSDDNRDDEIFGESAHHKKKDDHASENTTSLGGRVSVNSAAVLREGDDPSDIRFEYDATLYTYLDARPNDITRAFARLRTIHPNPYTNPRRSDDRSPRFDLDESWIKIAACERKTFVTFGRQHIKWGTGRFWNPSDFLAPTKDPFAVYDYRLGTDILKIHYPSEKSGANFYGIVDGDNLGRYKTPGAAVRAEFLGKTSEFSLTAYGRERRPGRLASDLSLGIGPVDVHGELVFSTLNKQTFYEGDGSISNPQAAQTYSREHEWIPQFVTGIKYEYQYADQKHITMELEYFYNGLGYNDRNLEMLAIASGDSVPLYSGRNYLGALLGLPHPGSLENTSFILSSLMNMSDQSGMARFSSQTTLYKEVLMELWASASYGQQGEFRFELPRGVPPSIQGPGGDVVSTITVASGISRAVGASMSMNF